LFHKLVDWTWIWIYVVEREGSNWKKKKKRKKRLAIGSKANRTIDGQGRCNERMMVMRRKGMGKGKGLSSCTYRTNDQKKQGRLLAATGKNEEDRQMKRENG